MDFQSGQDEVKRYRFSKGVLNHVFCGNCGNSVWEGKLLDSGEIRNFGINVGGHLFELIRARLWKSLLLLTFPQVRMLSGLDLKDLRYRYSDG